jgi:hypothetical protein
MEMRLPRVTEGIESGVTDGRVVRALFDGETTVTESVATLTASSCCSGRACTEVWCVKEACPVGFDSTVGS